MWPERSKRANVRGELPRWHARLQFGYSSNACGAAGAARARWQVDDGCGYGWRALRARVRVSDFVSKGEDEREMRVKVSSSPSSYSVSGRV